MTSVLVAAVLGQTLTLGHLPEPYRSQGERLVRLGASLRVEQEKPKPIEVWIDFDRPVSDDQLKQVAGMEPLTALRLLGRGFGDAGLANLKNLPRLWLLIVNSDRVTDKGAEAVSKLKGLRKLDFMFAKLTPRGLAHLHKLPKLEELYLHAAKIGEDALVPLAEMKGLRQLSLPKAISDQAVSRLRKALPNCRVSQI